MIEPRTGELPFNPENVLAADLAKSKGSFLEFSVGEHGVPEQDTLVRLQLVLFGELLDPFEISKELECPADEGLRAGDAEPGTDDRSPVGIWVIGSPEDVRLGFLDVAVAALLKRIKDRDGSLLALKGVQKAIVWGVVNSGMSRRFTVRNHLSPHALDLLAKRGIQFQF